MLTDRCDQACSFCYSKYKPRTELSFEKIVSVLDQAADLGAVWLVVTGGDPYRRRDLHAILQAAQERRFAVTLKTHGMHIDQDEAQRLSDLGVQRVDLSVHNRDPLKHDAVTRVPGSHRRTIAALEALKNVGITVKSSLVVTSNNVEDIPETLSMLVEKSAVNVGFSMGPSLTGSLDPQKQQAKGEALIRARMAVLNHGPHSGCVPESYPRPGDQDVPCQAGRGLAAILPDGNVTPCEVFPLILGNIHEESLASIWSGQAVQPLRESSYKDHKECSGCEAQGYCKFCPGYSYSERGDWRKASRSHCIPAYALKEAVRRIRAEKTEGDKELSQPAAVSRSA